MEYDVEKLVDAVVSEDISLTKKILATGLRADDKDAGGDEVIFTAINMGCGDKILKLLMSNIKVKGDYADEDGDTLLHESASTNNLTLVKMLLKGGINPDVENNQGTTPLMRAGMRGSRAVIETLIKAGADINHINDKGYTALMMASELGRDGFIERYLKHNPDLEIENHKGKKAEDIASNKAIKKLFADYRSTRLKLGKYADLL